jgi:hypothetical protein
MLHKYIPLVFILLVSIPNEAFSQYSGINRDKYRIPILKISGEIKLDGILDEEAWKQADFADQFHRVLPTDTGYAIAQTVVKLCYTESHLYLGIICLDPTPGDRPVESLRRDWSFMKNDNFIVFIDTYNDQTNGFAFGISPAGAQWDGIQSNGGKVNLDWDTKWRSEVRNYQDKWVAEFEIPFRSLRYNENSEEWGINFSRQDLKTGEKSSWAPMPRQFATATLAYTGSLIWEEPLSKAGTRFSVIPYVSAKATQETIAQGRITPAYSAGADAKVILSTSMNLDLTVNPDYSQVEVDRQQTNLDRFELFFPEKRQFFLENSDLFANLGAENLRPFFSRRIGLTDPVIAGARLSGKMGDNWRIGFMDMQTKGRTDLSSINYAVAAVQRNVFNQSSISGFLVNKQTFLAQSGSFNPKDLYNRVAGLEFNLASADNKWTGKSFYHQSFHDGLQKSSSVFSNTLTYSSQFLLATLKQAWVGKDFQADVGYIRRKGYLQLNPGIQYKFFPQNSSLANHGPGIEGDIFLDANSHITDRDIQVYYQFTWLNKSVLKARLRNSFLELQFPFDPTHLGGTPFSTGESFRQNEGGLSFESDIRKPFNYLLDVRFGDYFNGRKFTIDNQLYYRIQPYTSLSVISSYNRIQLPEPYTSAEFFLIGPRLDITLTNSLFITGLVQYNNQIDNFNVNFRLQWRFAPVSDLYIVYTENAHPLDYEVKNRGLVVKLSYWFN